MPVVVSVSAHPCTITDPQRITDLDIHRHDRLGGIIHEYAA